MVGNIGGKNSGPNASVGSARTANIALTANVALTANYASQATTASIVSWTGVQNAPAFVTAGQVTAVERATTAEVALTANAVLWADVNGRPTALSQFTNDSVYLTATATINTALLASTANVALQVANGAITATSIANGSVQPQCLAAQILTNNYFGNVSLNGTVSLDRLAVASTVLVAHLNADLLDGMDSSAFGDATAANQNTILARIGANTDAASMSSTLFAGQEMIYNMARRKYIDVFGGVNSCTGSFPSCPSGWSASQGYNTSYYVAFGSDLQRLSHPMLQRRIGVYIISR